MTVIAVEPGSPGYGGAQQAPATTAKGIYQRLASDREPYLQRARVASSLTIPSLIREQGSNSSSTLPTPFQSVGSRGVNNLAEKLTMAVMPPNAPFFKFVIQPYAADAVSGVPNAESQIQANLRKAEAAIDAAIETSGARAAVNEAMLHVVVAGSAVLALPLEDDDDEDPRVYHLDQFVLERTPAGRVTQLVLLDVVSESAMEPEHLALVRKPQVASVSDQVNLARTDKLHELYTWCRWNQAGEVWECDQWLDAVLVPDSGVKYKPDQFPYFPLRLKKSSSENYSRSYVEEYLGDLISLEGLTQAIVEGSAAAARIIYTVNPAGMTDINAISGKPNGAYVAGRAEDITAVGLNKFNDFKVAAETASTIEQRLSLAFMLASAVQRDAERVTAEEIRAMIGELEQAMGGVYTLFSRELQLPLVSYFKQKLTKAKQLPAMPKRVIRPVVVTGIDALGRGNDLQRIQMASSTADQVLGPGQQAHYLNPLEAMRRVYNAAGIRTDGLILTDAELAQSQNRGTLQELTGKLGPAAIQALSRAQQSRAQANEQQPAQPVQPANPQAQ